MRFLIKTLCLLILISSSGWLFTIYGNELLNSQSTRDNENYRIQSIEHKVYSADIWVDKSITTYTYSLNNKLLLEISQTYSSDQRINEEKILYTYDESGNNTKILKHNWSNDTWREVEKIEMEYNSYNQLVLSTICQKIMGIWRNVNKTEIKLNSQGLKDEEFLYFWDSGSWQKSCRDTFHYNQHDLVTQLLSYSWSGNTWQPSYTRMYTYDENLSLTKQEFKLYNHPNWINAGRWLYTYNDYNLDSLMLFQLWNENMYNDKRLETYFHDTQHNKTQIISSDMVGNVWIESWKDIYNWELNNSININPFLAQTPSRIKSSSYPNPFNPSTTISFELMHSEYITLSIHNILGQHITTLLNMHLTRGIHSATWNGYTSNNCMATSGIYYYTIKSKSKVLSTGKILLVK